MWGKVLWYVFGNIILCFYMVFGLLIEIVIRVNQEMYFEGKYEVIYLFENVLEQQVLEKYYLMIF